MDWVDMTNKAEKIRENRLRGEAAHFGIRMTEIARRTLARQPWWLHVGERFAQRRCDRVAV
jgi:hypothetical protein